MKAIKAILSTIGRVLGSVFIMLLVLLGALVLAEILVLAGAWAYASIFRHGQMASDETIFKIALVIAILFMLFYVGPLIPGSGRFAFWLGWFIRRALHPFVKPSVTPNEVMPTSAQGGIVTTTPQKPTPYGADEAQPTAQATTKHTPPTTK